MQAIQFYENLEDCDYFLLLENKNNPDATVFVVENGIIPPFQCAFPSELQHPFTISVKYGAINEGLLYEITSALTIKKLATATSKYIISSASADIAPLAEGRLFTIVVEATDGTNTYTKYSQVLCNTAQNSSAGGGVIWNPSPPPVYGYAQKIDSNGISLLKDLVAFANFKETGSQFIGKQPIFWRASEGVDSENDFKIEDAKIFKYIGGVWVEQSSAVDFENIDSDVKIINHGLYLTQNPGVDTVGDERFILGKHQKYVAGAGWVDISVAGNGALTTFLGYWDANTNTPTILSGDGTAGDWYLVDVAGTTSIDGLTPWGVGDVIWYDGDSGHWQMINNQTAAPTKPVGAAGAVQFKGAGGNFDWTTDLLFESTNRALALQRLKLYSGLFVVPIPGAVERDATDLYFTASDRVRRKIPVRLTTNKTFIGSATNEITEIGTTDIYGASTATKTFLDTEANWYDGSGYPKSSVFPGAGEVGQRHRNTKYIYECVAVGEWVRYILPNGYVDVWGLPLSEKVKLENAANWTGKVYTGTALSGCLAGYKHFTNDYVYEFVALNTPIRYARI